MAVAYILLGMGVFFILIGGTVGAIFIATSYRMDADLLSFVMIPLLFVIIGIVLVVIAARMILKARAVIKKGKRYPAKIYGYVEDTSVTINDRYPTNVIVHFFDENHVEREAVIPTSIPSGTGGYAIGMTMDIFEYRGKFSWDKQSVRFEELPGEAELMDDKPIAPDETHLIAVTCPTCGASYQAVKNYSNKCPYCGHYQNI